MHECVVSENLVISNFSNLFFNCGGNENVSYITDIWVSVFGCTLLCNCVLCDITQDTKIQQTTDNSIQKIIQDTRYKIQDTRHKTQVTQVTRDTSDTS